MEKNSSYIPLYIYKYASIVYFISIIGSFFERFILSSRETDLEEIRFSLSYVILALLFILFSNFLAKKSSELNFVSFKPLMFKNGSSILSVIFYLVFILSIPSLIVWLFFSIMFNLGVSRGSTFFDIITSIFSTNGLLFIPLLWMSFSFLLLDYRLNKKKKS